EHRFEVRLRTRGDFIVRKSAERVAFVGTLEVVVRGEIERRRSWNELVSRHLELFDERAADRIELLERTGRRSSRAAAAEPPAQGGDLGLREAGERAE